MKERFKSYTAQKKKPWHALSGDPREPFESIALCEHLASTPCFNQQIWGCNWSIKERFSLRFLYALLHKPLSCLNLKTALFCGGKKKKVCYGVYLDKSSFILFFGVLWIFMSFDGDGDREEDDVRTLCTYIIPPVFTDAFMQTLKDKKKKTCPVLEGTEPSSSLALIILPSSLSGPSCQYLLRHCDSFLFICLRNSPLPPPGIGEVSKFRLLCFFVSNEESQPSAM